MANEAGARGGSSEGATPMTESLARMCLERPDVVQAVIVVLQSGDTAPAAVGLRNYEPIRYQPGMFTATMAGAELLALAESPGVIEISLDDPVSAL